MTSKEPILEVENLNKHFSSDTGWLSSILGNSPPVRAVDGVNFTLNQKEILSIVGESGCGKSTLIKTIISLLDSTSGSITFKGQDITRLSNKEMRPLRQNIQIIYQDPFSSLNPKKKILELIKQPLDIHDIGTNEERVEKVREALSDVDLVPVEDFIHRYPEELSGGQLQRVAFARALVLNPELVVADEPSSMLDASIRARILDLIEDLREKHGISFIIITHDLSIARYISDRIAVMYLGRIVELADADGLIDEPKHPYSKALVESIPIPNPRSKVAASPIEGNVPDPVNLPSGCRFHPRCPAKQDHCERIDPEMRSVPDDSVDERQVACHEVEPKYVPQDHENTPMTN